MPGTSPTAPPTGDTTWKHDELLLEQTLQHDVHWALAICLIKSRLCSAEVLRGEDGLVQRVVLTNPQTPHLVQVEPALLEDSQDSNLQEVWSLLEEFRQSDHAGVDLYREVILTEEAREPHDGLCLFSSLDSNRYMSHKSNLTYPPPSLMSAFLQTAPPATLHISPASINC